MINEDSAFGPGMMFGIPGPGPSRDTKGIPSDKKKEKGKEIKKHFQKFESFIEEEKMISEIGDSSSKPFKWFTTMNVRKWLMDNVLAAKDKQHSGSEEDRYHKTTLSFRYEFTSDTTGTKYHVHIGGYFGKNLWLSFSGPKPKGWKPYHCVLGLGFGVDGQEGDPETNLGEHFRVMATVTECALDFIQKVLDDDDQVRIEAFHMNPKLDKEEQKGVDSRRGKLYLAYINNSFKKLRTDKQYRIEQSKDGFVLKFGESRMAHTGKIPDNVLAATYESNNQKIYTEMKKHIPSFNEYVVESTLNEANGPDLREVKKMLKGFLEKTKFVKNMKGMDWRVATEPIVVTNKDLDFKGSATGNYMVTGMYEKYGPHFMVEYIAVDRNPKFPKTVGTYAKEFDKAVWEKFLHDHKDQFLDPSRLDVKSITDISVHVEQFVISEMNAMAPQGSAGEDPNSIKSQLEKAFKAAEVSEISDGRLRVNFFFKRAGDGSAVPKTNLFFIINPTAQTVEFKNPDKINPAQEAFTSFRELVNTMKDFIALWKEEDQEKANRMSQSAFNLDR